ncbi:MAG: hypothetical protein ACKOQX_01675, partial [Actinomycetota bacterium]
MRVSFDAVSAETGAEEGAPVSAGPNPIAPEMKELVWGAGSFIVFSSNRIVATCHSFALLWHQEQPHEEQEHDER